MPTFHNVAVVGMHFRGREAVDAAAQLSAGTILRLEREPDNKYDYNAIKVHFEDMFLGYVEGSQAAWIAPHLDVSAAFKCIVIGKETRRNNIHPLVVITDSDEETEIAIRMANLGSEADAEHD